MSEHWRIFRELSQANGGDSTEGALAPSGSLSPRPSLSNSTDEATLFEPSPTSATGSSEAAQQPPPAATEAPPQSSTAPPSDEPPPSAPKPNKMRQLSQRLRRPMSTSQGKSSKRSVA